MQKTANGHYAAWWGQLWLKRTLLVMKLTIILLTVALLEVHATGTSQVITLSGKDIPVRKVFAAIKNQTGFIVFGNASLSKNAKPVTIDVKGMPLTEFLQLVMKDQPFNYEIADKTIILSENTATQGVDLKSTPSPFPSLTSPPITVRGRIVNENNQPVIASVIIKGTKRGTTSDGEGFFTLNNVDDNAELIISATNIETVTARVNGNASLNISVKMNSSSLNEVIVNKGYYTEKQRLSTGNVSKVDAKDIENQPVTSPLLALQGKIPGVEITPTSGAPGSAVKIRIRGLNSLRNGTGADGIDGNLPLYIIDGIPISSTPVSTRSLSAVREGFDPLSTINPANIESIQILKDADATAIYGSRGANGVILITTKNKRSVQGLNTDAGYYHGVGKLVNHMELLSTQEYLAMRREAVKNDGGEAEANYNDPDLRAFYYSDLFFYDTTRYTNWQDKILGQSSNINDAQINISGGTGRTNIGFGVSYHNESIIYAGDFGYNRYSGNLNLNHSSLDGRFNMSISSNYGIDNHRLFDSDRLFSTVLTTRPNSPEIYNEDGTLNWAVNFGTNTWVNPFSYLKVTQAASSHNFITNASVNYDLSHGFQFTTHLGFSRYDHDEKITTPISSLNPFDPFAALEGKTQETATKRTSWIIEPQISYNKKIGDHSINSLVGLSLQETGSQFQSLLGTGYKSDALLGIIGNASQIRSAGSNTEYRYGAVFMRVGYNYREKYVLNITGRRDGSSRFGPGNRYGNFGAVGAAWIFSEENFLDNLSNILSFGKVRASYGVTGNDQIGDSKYIKTYRASDNTYYNTRGMVPTALFNPDYAWETTRKLEAAIELGFINDRISIAVSTYRNRSSNQLVQYQLPVLTGFESVLNNFDATVQNTGWEYVLTTRNIDNKKFKWTTTFNISVSKNKLIKFDGIEESPYATTFKVGEPLDLFFGYTWLGVDPATGLHTFKDINGDGEITSLDFSLVKPLITKYFGGITNSFSCGGFELNFLIQFSDRDALTRYFGMPGSGINQPVSVLNRWQKPGDITSAQRFATGGNARTIYSRFESSNGSIKQISFFRLKTLTLSYSPSALLLKKINIKGAKLFIQAQNLFTQTNFEGWDPETVYGMPPLKIISGGIQLKF